METKEKDFSCLDLAVYLNNCQAHYPISDEYEKLHPQENGRWWKDKSELLVGGQKIHIIAYFGMCWKLSETNKDSMRHVWSKQGLDRKSVV